MCAAAGWAIGDRPPPWVAGVAGACWLLLIALRYVADRARRTVAAMPAAAAACLPSVSLPPSLPPSLLPPSLPPPRPARWFTVHGLLQRCVHRRAGQTRNAREEVSRALTHARLPACAVAQRKRMRRWPSTPCTLYKLVNVGITTSPLKSHQCQIPDTSMAPGPGRLSLLNLLPSANVFCFFRVYGGGCCGFGISPVPATATATPERVHAERRHFPRVPCAACCVCSGGRGV